MRAAPSWAAGSPYEDHRQGMDRWLPEFIAIPDRDIAGIASDD